MSVKTHAIARLQAAHCVEAAETLTRAFADDPIYTYVFPDSDTRLRATRRMWEALLAAGLRYGEVYTTPTRQGIACWMAPGRTEMTLVQQARTGFGLVRAIFAFPAASRQRFYGIARYTDELRRRDMQRPFWYLWVIGVDPACQGQGIGSQLMQPVLARADAQGLPCYLETETERNVAFYERCGFRVLRSGQAPGHPIRLWTMVRKARPVGESEPAHLPT